MGNYTIFLKFENPRGGRQARNFSENDQKILDLKSSSEQIIFRKLSYCSLAIARCQFLIGGRVFDVRADLGSFMVSLKFLFGLLTTVLVIHCFVASCKSQPCRFSSTKTLPMRPRVYLVFISTISYPNMSSFGCKNCYYT